MKVLLINPAIRPNSPKCLLNVGLAYVATAISRAGFELTIFDVDAHRYSDDEVERFIRINQFDVVAIGDLVSHYRWVKWLAKIVKEHHPRVPVIAGNTVSTSIPRLLLEKTAVDIAVISEGDITIVELLTALALNRPLQEVNGIAFTMDGAIHLTPTRPVIDPLDSMPFPDYDLFELHIYLEKSKWLVNGPEALDIPLDDIVAMPVVTARGCPFTCTFCYHAFQHKKYRYHSPEAIVGEIERLKQRYGVNYIQFWDELSFCETGQARRVAQLLIDRKVGVRWEGTCRSELIDQTNIDLASLFKQAGCNGMSFSLENGNEEILRVMNKRNVPKDFVFQAHALQEAGVPTYTAIVLGYPQETLQTITETFDVLREARIYPSVGFLQPMPGTPMFDLAVESGCIPDVEAYLMRMGDRQDLRVNMTTLPEDVMMHHVERELHALNEELQVGLSHSDLIRTGVYRRAKSESFVNSFGIAARVSRESGGSNVPPTVDTTS